MGDEKRYYWLKLPEDFYDDDTIQWIEDQENGQAYVNFYLKLLLKSLVDDGYLVRYVGSKLIPYDIKSLARLTNTDPDTVRVAMNLFKEIGLIEMLDSGEIFMSQIEEMIGTETQAARRMRKLRAKESVKAISNDNRNIVTEKSNKVTDERNNVTNMRNSVQKCYTEKEIEKDIEIDKDIDIENRYIYSRAEHDDASSKIPYEEIVQYLNSKANRDYKPTTKKTQSLIKARYNEGFTLDDFKTVVDNKTTAWKDKPDWDKYLRPETLFGTKFEGYLNEKQVVSDYDKSRDDFMKGLSV